ncbi:MAG: sugar transferase [Clostridiales bacterium]|nr:sugar transferase [Clostridiales bacterium]
MLVLKPAERELLEQQIADESIPASEIDPALVTGYRGFYNRVVKRCLDFIIALILLLILWPIYLIIALAIVIDDGFPVFYRAERGGYHQKNFRIFKFRTMVKNADQIGGGTTALHDSRITRVGGFLRKVKLDEWGNIFSVLTGAMSLIGPRPELVSYVEKYSGAERLISEVRPGITDYSSLEFISLDEIVGGDNADEQYEKIVLPRKNKLRVKYAATVSFATDVKLLFLTVWAVLRKAKNVIFRKKPAEKEAARQTADK